LDSFDKPEGPDRLNSTPPPEPEPAPAPPDEPDDSQLPPSAWLVRNGTTLLIFAGLIGLLLWKWGLGSTLNLALVGLGLGLVIFIHELGHFAVAKWCNVYVETFSIGFGPALPGCRVKYGETVYKLALFPLGGYVKMLGEGEGEDDENESNPRSYKNKTVPQRMAIISAGVIMNVILGCICFVAVYTHGKGRIAPIIEQVETASPAWQKGITKSAVLVQVGGRVATPNRPLSFDNDLRRFVMVSNPGEKFKLVYELYEPIGHPNAKPKRYEIEIAPRKDADDMQPVIGLRHAECLRLEKSGLLPTEFKNPVRPGSAAAAAREPLPLKPGDRVTATSDPDKPDQMRPLSENGDGPDADRKRDFELAQRYLAFAGKPMKVSVRRADGKVEELGSSSAAFAFGDVIIATTDPEDKEGKVTPLPADPRNPGGELPDYFAFDKRLRLLGGRFVTIRVRRDKGQEVDLVVPPPYHFRLPARMRMGQVVALRDPVGATGPATASEDDVKTGDIIDAITLTSGNQKRRFVISGKADGADAEMIDPVRLPDALEAWAWAHPNTQVTFDVRRDNQQHERKPTELKKEVPWDYAERWRFAGEAPLGARAPVSIPALGIAYRVDPMVEEVEAGSSTLQKNDVVKRIWVQAGTKGEWVKVEPGGWGHIFLAVQRLAESGPVKLEVERGGAVVPVEVTPAADVSWPRADLGLLMQDDKRVQQADHVGEAMLMGLQDTWDWIKFIVLSLKQMIVGNISFMQMGGPVSIGVTAYSAAGMGFWEFIFFIGLISINLAVINFLPVPFLDGGHMMFLTYEGLRGKPAPEMVQTVATLGGVLFLISVMVFVFYLDLMRVIKWFF
jgi:regulator of sigma E protease